MPPSTMPQAVVVLMTPDEIAYLQTQYSSGDGDPETQPAAQARPNVLFEAGMALGRDARRTVLVELGEVRPFSDVAGRHAVRLSNDPATRQALAKRNPASPGCVTLMERPPPGRTKHAQKLGSDAVAGLASQRLCRHRRI